MFDRNKVVPIAPEEKHLWEILVPKKDNHGVRFTKEHHQYVYASLRNFSGGLTRFPAVHGESEYEHQPYVEMLIPVRFTATVFEAKRIARFARQHYRQIEIMLTLIARSGEFFFVGEEEQDEAEPIEEKALAATN